MLLPEKKRKTPNATHCAPPFLWQSLHLWSRRGALPIPRKKLMAFVKNGSSTTGPLKFKHKPLKKGLTCLTSFKIIRKMVWGGVLGMKKPLINHPIYTPYIVGILAGISPFTGLLKGLKQLGPDDSKRTTIFPMIKGKICFQPPFFTGNVAWPGCILQWTILLGCSLNLAHGEEMRKWWVYRIRLDSNIIGIMSICVYMCIKQI